MATSTKQTVATVPVYDYLQNPGDATLTSAPALAGKQVKVTLSYDKARSIAPVTWLENLTVYSTKTDQNGFWQVNVVPTDNIAPANTYYIVEVEGYLSYKINPTQAGVPGIGWQSSAILLDIPPSLTPAGQIITGNLEVQGYLKADKDFRRSFQSISEATLVAGLDPTLGEIIEVTLTANRVVGLPVNPFQGQRVELIVTQNATGGWTLTWPAGIKTSWQPVPVANAISSVAFEYDGTSWFMVAGGAPVSSAGVLSFPGAGVFQSLTVTSGPYTPTALTGGGDFAARVRMAAGPLWDITNPTLGGGTGVADNGPIINTALANANAAGGGYAYVPAGTYTFSTAIQLLNSAKLWLDPGAIIQWTGTVSASIITNAAANPLMRSGVVGGGRLDPKTTATGFGIDLHSPQFCEFDVELLDGSATFTAMRWASDATNAVGYENTRNAVFNYVPRFKFGVCGTGHQLNGQATGAITLNRWDLIDGGPVSVVGMVNGNGGFNDTNSVGQARFKLGANNAVGLDLGASDAATNVYNWSFQNLATDDPTNTFTGLIGIDLRNSTKCIFANFYPQFTGGTPIDFGVSASYLIRETYAGGGNLIYERKSGVIGQSRFLQLPAFAASYTPNLDLGDYIAMTLTGAITVNLPTTPTTGVNPEITFEWIQDATANRVVTYNANYKIGSSAPAPIIASSGNTTIDRFIWDNSFWRLVSRMTGY